MGEQDGEKEDGGIRKKKAEVGGRRNEGTAGLHLNVVNLKDSGLEI